jgi:CRP-like cAMP-binding protein
VHQNTILSALHSLHPAFVAKSTKQITFDHGDHLARAGTRIDRLFFPTSGLVSIVTELPEGETIEAAMVGRSGTIGGSALLGANIQIGTSFGQIPGDGWSMSAEDLLALAREDPKVQSLFVRNEQFLLAQSQQTAACNAKHQIGPRFATWILRARDASGSHVLHLTQEFIAQMLGVQRPSVSVFANALQEKGLITYRRGNIQIADEVGLKRHACGCYEALLQTRRRIFTRSCG